MKLYLIHEDKELLLIEEGFRTHTLNEGLGDIIDTATETFFGAIGFIPGIGEPADLAMVVKNLIQGDYLGAAIFLISMEPSPISDAIGKTLRIIQKIAKHTGQEKRLNKFIGWLLKKTGNDPKGKIMALFGNAKKAIGAVDNKAKATSGAKDPKIKKSAGVMGNLISRIEENMNKMEEHLGGFLDLIEKKADVSGGIDIDEADIVNEFVADFAEEIRATYDNLREKDVQNKTRKAIEYKNKVENNARNKPEIRKAYEIVFGPIRDEIK